MFFKKLSTSGKAYIDELFDSAKPYLKAQEEFEALFQKRMTEIFSSLFMPADKNAKMMNDEKLPEKEKPTDPE